MPELGNKVSTTLWDLLSEEDYYNIVYYMGEKYGWELNTVLTEDNIDKFNRDFESAKKALENEKAESQNFDDDDEDEDDDEELEEFSFYCSNNDGEGTVTFVDDDSGRWREHWDWESYDEEVDTTPSPMRYMSYLTKSDIKQYLRQDGFFNISEVE